MTKMSDLSHDLVEEILCMVPITSLRAVRSTCKLWNVLSKNRILCKAEARNQFLGFTMMNHRLYSMRFNLHGIGLNEDGEEFTDPSIKPIGDILNQVEISKVFYCEGLLLCVTRNHSSKLVVWNPYLGQTRWIQPSNDYHIGVTYALGYDNNKNHKILRFFAGQGSYEIYDLKSNSWSLSYVIPIRGLKIYQPGTSLNGNAYFLTDARKVMEGCDCLLGFDFTTEKFGQLLSLSFSHDFTETGRLSCVNGEKLAALYHRYETFETEIWVTTKIEPNEVSWSKFLAVDMEPFTSLKFHDDVGSFFIEEEKKIAVLFDLDESERYNIVYIIGDNGCLKEVDLDEVVNPQESVEVDRMFYFSPFVCSCSYVPSVVKINQIAEHERKYKKRKRKRTNKKRIKISAFEIECFRKVTTNQHRAEKTVRAGYDFILCFDFTTERFGQILPLPFKHYIWTLSCVKEEKLAVAVLCWENTYVIEIWMTIKIDPNAASWSKFLRVDRKPPIGLGFVFANRDDSFFIDEEKKVAVVFSSDEVETSTAYIIRDNKYLKTVDLEKAANFQESLYCFLPLVCSCSSYYVPSLVQINQIAGHKSKDKKRKRTNKV
ncbi:unnamed protein product [Arabidopsis lyrata]|uniref:Predicted protein n=1 Tax=Arabidopsis lyrata subsp. lyrata TaxID=81972 RepID=D7KHG2_ARALL|nr:predicted protein [Arabidopsis lyrata subsp. lyrata]CAH8254377.1 unnamed protein product [Arabidopsis lyrata]